MEKIINYIESAKPELIIFDCDGTLMDTLWAHYKAWNTTFTHFKHSFISEYEFMNTYKGMNGAELINTISILNKFNPQTNEMIAMKNSIFENDYAHQVKPFADMISIINRYYNKTLMTIASNGCRESVITMLKHNNLDHVFKLIVAIEDVVYGKPKPDMFLLSANKLNVSNNKCLILEDSEHGFIAANSANMQFIDVTQYRSCNVNT
jgi:beta-phosphoglucomutase-like phosphatase (HAD superfamily)